MYDTLNVLYKKKFEYFQTMYKLLSALFSDTMKFSPGYIQANKNYTLPYINSI